VNELDSANDEYEAPAITVLGSVDGLTAGKLDTSANDLTTTG
jgi:hypothetical protein